MRLCLNSIIHEVLFIGELLLSLRVLLLSSSRAGAFLQAIRCFPEREIINRLRHNSGAYLSSHYVKLYSVYSINLYFVKLLIPLSEFSEAVSEVLLISLENISCVNLILNIIKTSIISIGNDCLRYRLEFL